jgi:hypothetical protein
MNSSTQLENSTGEETMVNVDRIWTLVHNDDDSKVGLDSYAGGAAPGGAWSYLTLRFTDPDGVESIVRYDRGSAMDCIRFIPESEHAPVSGECATIPGDGGNGPKERSYLSNASAYTNGLRDLAPGDNVSPAVAAVLCDCADIIDAQNARFDAILKIMGGAP